MAVTKTSYGRYAIYVSDETAAADIAKELAQQLHNDGIPEHKVIEFDTTNKIVIVSQ